MKHFAAISRMLDLEKNKVYREEHLAYLDGLAAKGKVFAKGRFADMAGGLVVYRAETLEEARSYAENDPYVLKGARAFELHEWEMFVEGQ